MHATTSQFQSLVGILSNNTANVRNPVLEVEGFLLHRSTLFRTLELIKFPVFLTTKENILYEVNIGEAVGTIRDTRENVKINLSITGV